MIIILKQNAPEQRVQALIEEVKELGMQVHFSKGEETTIMGLVGDTSRALQGGQPPLSPGRYPHQSGRAHHWRRFLPCHGGALLGGE